MYGYVWLCRSMPRGPGVYVGICMAVYGYIGLCMAMYGYVGPCRGYIWLCMAM